MATEASTPRTVRGIKSSTRVKPRVSKLPSCLRPMPISRCRYGWPIPGRAGGVGGGDGGAGGETGGSGPPLEPLPGPGPEGGHSGFRRLDLLDDARRERDDDVPPDLLLTLISEQPPDDGQVAEKRGVPGRLARLILDESSQEPGLGIPHLDEGVQAPRVDAGEEVAPDQFADARDFED